jgi:hypothetical protein
MEYLQRFSPGRDPASALGAIALQPEARTRELQAIHAEVGRAEAEADNDPLSAVPAARRLGHRPISGRRS